MATAVFIQPAMHKACRRTIYNVFKRGDGMREISKNIELENWTIAPLKRFLHVQSGEMISFEDEVEEGVPIIGGNGIRGYTYKTNSKSPALVIGRVGAKCGCVHLIKEDFWASEHAFVVKPRRPFQLDYAKYMIEVLDLNSKAIRTAQPLINTQIVEETIGYFPPLPQ